jgi:hypothetical protein
MSSSLVSLATIVGLWFCFTVLCCSAGGRRSITASTELTTEHRNAINSALRANGYPSPQSLEISEGGWLVATFELRGAARGGSFEAFGTGAVVTIREAMLPFKTVSNYRVTVNGPSPGTGLIRRYGSARFIEGDRVQWGARHSVILRWRFSRVMVIKTAFFAVLLFFSER